MSIVLFLLLDGCVPEGTPATAVDTEDDALFDPALSAGRISFGAVTVGTIATSDLTLTNRGDLPLEVTLGSTDAADVTIAAPPGPLAPGEMAVFPVTWRPGARGTLDGTLDLVLTDGTHFGEGHVGLVGTAVAGEVALSVSDLDFDSVVVGCSDTKRVTVFNAGELPLSILGATVSDPAPYSLSDSEGAPLTFPLVVDPGGSTPIVVTWAPVTAGATEATLALTTDDPVHPAIPVGLRGFADAADAGSVTFDPILERHITALFAINMYANREPWAPGLQGDLPLLFETLSETGFPFRVAFVWDRSGAVLGGVPYVDDTMDPDAAAADALEMFQDVGGDDNDELLRTLGYAIGENRSWLLDEERGWAESRLNLVGITPDADASPGNYRTWIAAYQAYKTDPADIVAHGIAGTFHSLCDGLTHPNEAFIDASLATGGTFQSICGDWPTIYRTLGEAMVPPLDVFVLEDTPLEWSLVVSVDGAIRPDGWEWEAERKAVVFPDDGYPSVGSVVRVDYLEQPVCDE